MNKQELQEKRDALAQAITTMRQQAGELEVAIRRNEGAYLAIEQIMAEMEKEGGEGEPEE